MKKNLVIAAAALAFAAAAAHSFGSDPELEAKMTQFEANLTDSSVPPAWFEQAAEENEYVKAEAKRRFDYGAFYASDMQACRKQAVGATPTFNANSIVTCIRGRDEARFDRGAVVAVAGILGIFLGGAAFGPGRGGAG